MTRRRTRSDGTGDGAGSPGGDWKQAMPAVTLVTVVLVILVLSSILQTDREMPQDEPLEPEMEPAESPEEVPAAAESEPAGTAEPPAARREPPPTSGPVERRAREDNRRLASRHGDWTLQLMIACDPANAARLVERSQGSENLYVLPFDYRGRRCFRICWGSYATRDEAAAGRDRLPLFARNLGKSTPKAVAEVSP